MQMFLHHGKRSGFALVLALGLMALMVLLAAVISALVSVELTNHRQMRDSALARQNAYAAVLLALGQLQQHAGPDQRITANAQILVGPDDDIPVHPQWVGVWATDKADFNTQTLSHDGVSGTKDSDGIGKAARWLVSSSPQEYVVSPSATIAGKAVVLVGRASVIDVAGYVKVPLVDIAQEKTDGAGRYAWWVGDEGAKGNLYERMPHARLGVAHYQHFSLKNGSAVLREDGQEAAHLFGDISAFTQSERLSKLSQLDYVSTGGLSVAKNLFHTATFWSRGVMSNTKDGGLRKDICDYARLPNGPIFAADTANAPMRWEMIKAFLSMGNELGISSDDEDPSVAPRPQYPNNQKDSYQHAVHPVPVRLGVYVDPAFIDYGNNRYGIRLYFFPVIALWNPYDVAISPARYRLSQWAGSQTSKIQFSVGRWDDSDRWQSTGMLVKRGHGDVPDIVEDDRVSAYVFRSPLLVSSNEFNMRYTIEDTQGIAPGECVVFSASGLRPYERSELGNVLYRGFRSGEGFYLDVAPADDAADFRVDSSALYKFDVPQEGNIRDYRIDLGVQAASEKKENLIPERWSFIQINGNKSGDSYMMIAGLNRAGLGNSMPSRAITERIAWGRSNDARPRAFRPSVRTPESADPMPLGRYISENAENDLDDFPAYGTLFELKQAFNDQNRLTREGRRRWLANFNPRAIKVHYLEDAAGEDNQTFIGHLRARSNDLADSQSDLYYTPVSVDDRLFFGYACDEGPKQTVLFHVPRKDIPVRGVGDLMHLNISAADVSLTSGVRSPTNMIPAYAVGNSLESPMLDSGTLYRDYSGGSAITSFFDYSYLLNAALWDKYFASTDLFDGNGPHDKRFVPVNSKNLTEIVYSTEKPAYDYAAARWMLEGAFNVNSTDERSWAMLLASTFGTSVVGKTGNAVAIEDRGQFLRTFRSFEDNAFDGVSEKDSSAYAGLRGLSETEITDLSREIVKEVKRRGPFFSLSEFINRNPDVRAAAAHRQKGPLQAAIDASGINAGFLEKLASDDATDNDPIGDLPNPEALYGPIGEGVPGFLTQADLLLKIGNRLSARSDTFIIRGYAEIDGENPGTQTRAVCEAIVQRIPEYVDPQADDAVIFPPVSALNKVLGRRFVIRSLRWISPSDI